MMLKNTIAILTDIYTNENKIRAMQCHCDPRNVADVPFIGCKNRRMRDVHVKWRLFSLPSALNLSLFSVKTRTPSIYSDVFTANNLKRILPMLSYRKIRFKRHLRQYCASSNTCRHTWRHLKDVWRKDGAGPGTLWLTPRKTNTIAIPPTGVRT